MELNLSQTNACMGHAWRAEEIGLGSGSPGGILWSRMSADRTIKKKLNNFREPVRLPAEDTTISIAFTV